MQNNNIEMIDWAGNVLFEGDYKDPQVDKVLEANRCHCEPQYADNDDCPKCDGSGYWGDFTVWWQDKDRQDSVFDFINY